MLPRGGARVVPYAPPIAILPVAVNKRITATLPSRCPPRAHGGVSPRSTRDVPAVGGVEHDSRPHPAGSQRAAPEKRRVLGYWQIPPRSRAIPYGVEGWDPLAHHEAHVQYREAVSRAVSDRIEPVQTQLLLLRPLGAPLLQLRGRIDFLWMYRDWTPGTLLKNDAHCVARKNLTCRAVNLVDRG